ncbi:TPA: fimbrial protein [Kluyvera georgiana]
MKISNFCALRLPPFIVMLLGISVIPSAWANCTGPGGGKLYTMPAELSFPDQFVGQDSYFSQIGNVYNNGYVFIECTDQPENIKEGMVNTQSPVIIPGTSVTGFKTNLDNIYIALSWRYSGTSSTERPVSGSLTSGTHAFSASDHTPEMHAVLYVAGGSSIGPGAHTIDFSGWKAQYWVNDGQSLAVEVKFNPVTLIVYGGSCNLDTKILNVPLETVHPNDITDGQSATVGFGKIELSNCDAGVYPAVDFYADNRSADGSTLYLNPSSTAEGVGIKIKGDGATVTDFTKDFYSSDLLLRQATTAGGSASLDFSVQYIKTGVVKGGTVSATTNFVMYYR